MSGEGFSWRRVNGMLVRQWYGTIRSFDRMTDAFYWVTIDLVLWGLMAGYVQESIPAGSADVFLTLTTSVVMWNAVYRSQMDIGMGILDELWNKNLVNLFASPLTPREWVTSLLTFSVFKAVVAVTFGAFMAWLLYGFVLFSTLGWYVVPLFVVLMMMGWWIGFIVISVILHLTTKAQAVAWTLVWLLAPLSAIYFPLSSLPSAAQALGRLVPASYAFEEIRHIIAGRELDWGSLGIATGLNIVYLTVAILIMRRSFVRVLQKGLVKVY